MASDREVIPGFAEFQGVGRGVDRSTADWRKERDFVTVREQGVRGGELAIAGQNDAAGDFPQAGVADRVILEKSRQAGSLGDLGILSGIAHHVLQHSEKEHTHAHDEVAGNIQDNRRLRALPRCSGLQ